MGFQSINTCWHTRTWYAQPFVLFFAGSCFLVQLVSGSRVTKFCWGLSSFKAATSGRISQTSTLTIVPPAIGLSALGSPSKVLASTFVSHSMWHITAHPCTCSPIPHLHVDHPSPSGNYSNRAHFSLPQPLHLRATLKDQMGQSVSVRFEQVQRMHCSSAYI